MQPWVKTAVAFVVGLLLGGTATALYIHHCFTRAWVNSGNHQHAVERLGTELGLSADQKDRVGKIFDEEKPQMEALRQETNVKLKALKDATALRIDKVLTPDQLKKFNDLRAKWDARMAKDDKGWHIPGLPPGPPPGGHDPFCTPTVGK